MVGSCPEDDYDAADNKLIGGTIGSNHGRDANGRRMIAVTLKDVAGLVPGAYKGRGRGNKVRVNTPFFYLIRKKLVAPGFDIT